MSVWDEIDVLLDQYDGSIKVEGMSECMWGGHLRLTLTNPPGAPSRSMTFYKVAGNDPVEIAEAVLADARAWLAESGITPLAVQRLSG